MRDAHRIDLPQGTLDLLILQALALQSLLYPALHRLQRRAQEIPAC